MEFLKYMYTGTNYILKKNQKIVPKQETPKQKLVFFEKIKKGDNYLVPEIEIIADDALTEEKKKELEHCVKNWISANVNEVLCDLINLTKIKIENQYLRALAYQLYENNGVLKRQKIKHKLELAKETLKG